MKKLLGILVLGLVWCNIGVTAEFSTKTYINCEPKFKDKLFKTVITDVKYISFDPTVIYYEWHSKKKEFLKKSKSIKVWEHTYVFQINHRRDDKFFKWDELTIDRYTGIMKAEKWYNNISTKEKLVSFDREFHCEKIEKKDLPTIKAKAQKF